MLRNIAGNLVGTILPSVAALVAVPLLVGHLGMNIFGVFSLQVAALFFFGLSDFGVSRAIVLLSFDEAFSGNAGWRHPYRIGLRYSTALALITAVLGLPVGALLLKWHPAQVDSQDLAVSTMVMFFSAGLMLLSQAPRAVLEAQERFVLANVIRGPSAAAIFLAPLVAFHVADATLTSAAAGVFLTRAVSAVCYFWACGARRDEPVAQPATPESDAVDRGRRRAFLHKAGWLGLGNVLSMLVAYMDRFLIGAIGSATMVGQYVIAQEVVTKMWIASGAVISAGTPRMAAQRSEISSVGLKKTVRQLTGMMWLGGALPAVVLIVWGGPILELWLGKNFDPASVAPLQIMAVGLAVNTLSQINFSLLQIHGGEQRAAYLQVLNVLFVAVAVVVLVPVLGINGAALAFTARLMLDAFLVRRLLDTANESCRKIGVSNIALAGCSAVFLCLLFVF